MNLPAIAIVISSPHTCRICYEPCEQTSPCKCTGSMKYVHQECLDKWIRISGRRTCELCREPFDDQNLYHFEYAIQALIHIMIFIFVVMFVIVFIKAL